MTKAEILKELMKIDSLIDDLDCAVSEENEIDGILVHSISAFLYQSDRVIHLVKEHMKD